MLARAATFAGGVGTRHATKMARLELRPNRRVKHREDHKVGKGAGLKAARSYLKNALVPALRRGLNPFEQLRALITVGLTQGGIVTLRQNVLSTNLDQFYFRWARLVRRLQETYNAAYNRAARKSQRQRQERSAGSGALRRSPVGLLLLAARRATRVTQ